VNDLEAKLRALTFREPPPGLRGTVLAATPEKSGWRTWLAPHPAAWAALAAVWLALAILGRLIEKPVAPRPALATQSDTMAPSALLAFHAQFVREERQ
jgi:hypothetical protein